MGLWTLSTLDKEGKDTLSGVAVWEAGLLSVRQGSTAEGEQVPCHLIGPFLCMGGAQDLAGMWQQAAALGGQNLGLCGLWLLILSAGLMTTRDSLEYV